MKTKIFLTLALLASHLSLATVGKDQINEVRSCLEKVKISSNFEAQKALAQKCFEEAREFKNNESIGARSLYLEALAFYLSFASNDSPEMISSELTSYYKNKLSLDLKEPKIHGWSTLSLEDAVNAISFLSFYSSLTSIDESALRDSSRIIKVLKSRHHLRPEFAIIYYKMLIEWGEWKAASEFSQSYLGFLDLPQVAESIVVQPEDLGFYQLSSDLNSVELKKFELGAGPRIVMFGDCHFANDAMDILSKDPGIVSLMKSFGFVIAGNKNPEFDEMDRLRKHYPAFEMHPVYKAGSWFQQGYDVLASPNIAFFEDGVMKYRFIGAGPHLLKEFCRGLKEIGLDGKSEACR